MTESRIKSSERIDNSMELFCFKVTYEDGDVYYYIDSSMGDALRSAEEICGVKNIEYIGKGAIGS